MVSRVVWSAALLVLGGCHIVFGFEREPEPPPVPGEWAMVASGIAQSCAIQTEGSLWCWGDNGFGQLGLGPAADVEVKTPQRVGDEIWLSVAAGAAHTCGIRDDGSLWCWGYNGYGQLGDNSRVNRSEPVRVGTQTWKVVGLGEYTTCAIRDDESLWCWGYNASGQVGDGTANERGEPTLIDGNRNWTSLSLSLLHSCAITEEHQLWCWGYGPFGVPGYTLEATPVQLGQGDEWTAVGTMIGTTCGLTAGQVRCWGENDAAQLGDGTMDAHAAPAPIATDRTDWVQLAMRWRTACAIASDRTMACWGENRRGQLGSDTALPIQATPHVIDETWKHASPSLLHTCAVDGSSHLFCTGGNGSGQRGDGTGGSVLEPVMIPGTWSAVAASDAFACGISANRLFCWGDNDRGQLGEGTVFARQVPTATSMPSPTPKLALGARHVCDVDTAGKLYCWGDNREYQLSVSTKDHETTPVLVANPQFSSVGAIAAYDHSCAQGTDSKIYCWGFNGYGQLGRGSAGPSAPTIVPVVDATSGTALPFGIVTAGATFGCGTINTYVYCWGFNAKGQLGIGSTTNAPRATLTGQTATKLDGGAEHACLINGSNQLMCWGSNASGQLGDGSTMPMRTTPTLVASTGWTSVSAGAEHTCAIRNDNSLWCWGGNNRGALGNGTRTATNAPVTRLGTAQWLTVSAGAGYTCGIQMNGSLWCWGAALWGQLGTGTAWSSSFVQIGKP